MEKSKKKIPPNVDYKKIAIQRKLFCRYYTQNTEFFGNATLSYAEAYGHDLDSLSKVQEKTPKGKNIPGTSEYEKAYHVCSSGGERLLRKDDIQKLITKYLNELLKDEIVDRELVRVILQNYELPAKVAAIREYNKLKQRITDKADITSDGLPIKLISYKDVVKK